MAMLTATQADMLRGRGAAMGWSASTSVTAVGRATAVAQPREGTRFPSVQTRRRTTATRRKTVGKSRGSDCSATALSRNHAADLTKFYLLRRRPNCRALIRLLFSPSPVGLYSLSRRLVSESLARGRFNEDETPNEPLDTHDSHDSQCGVESDLQIAEAVLHMRHHPLRNAADSGAFHLCERHR